MSADYSTIKCKSYMAGRESVLSVYCLCNVYAYTDVQSMCKVLLSVWLQSLNANCNSFVKCAFFFLSHVHDMYVNPSHSPYVQFLYVLHIGRGCRWHIPVICQSRGVVGECRRLTMVESSYYVFLIKELSAEAQRQNSSQRKVTCYGDPSPWIWRLSFQYPSCHN